MTDTKPKIWTGPILDLDSGHFDSQNAEDEAHQHLAYALEEYFVNHLTGISSLDGGGYLVKVWDDIEDELVNRGIIALVEYLGEKFLATVAVPQSVLNASNLLNRFETVELTLLSNKNIKLVSTKGITKDLQTGKVRPADPKGYPYQFCIFQNNRDCVGYLNRIKYFVKQILNCAKKINWDAYMSMKRMIVLSKEDLAPEDFDIFLKGWKKREVAVLSVQHSRNPTPESRNQGKQGLSQHEMNFSVYEPKTDERLKLERDLKFWLELAERLCGIRSDVLRDKDQRASVQEVLSSQASYDSFEQKGMRWRIRGIREYLEVFGDKDANLTLKYGQLEKKP